MIATTGPSGPARLLAILLLLGTVLFAAAGLAHPYLHGAPEDVLRRIAATPRWSSIHSILVLATGLIIVGLWCRLFLPGAGTFPRVTLVALSALTLGHALNALNTLFMTGAGTQMARLYASGNVAMVPLFEALHPFGLVAARLGNLVAALGAVMLGWISTAEGEPRWLGGLAWLAGLGGLIGVLLAGWATEFANQLPVATVALLVFWQFAVALRVLLVSGKRVPAGPGEPGFGGPLRAQ